MKFLRLIWYLLRTVNRKCRSSNIFKNKFHLRKKMNKKPAIIWSHVQCWLCEKKWLPKIFEYQIVLKFWKWKQKTIRFILVWHHWWCDHTVNGKKLVSWHSLMQDWVYGYSNYREKIKEIQFTVLCTVQLIIRNWNWLKWRKIRLNETAPKKNWKNRFFLSILSRSDLFRFNSVSNRNVSTRNYLKLWSIHFYLEN